MIQIQIGKVYILDKKLFKCIKHFKGVLGTFQQIDRNGKNISSFALKNVGVIKNDGSVIIQNRINELKPYNFNQLRLFR